MLGPAWDRPKAPPWRMAIAFSAEAEGMAELQQLLTRRPPSSFAYLADWPADLRPLLRLPLSRMHSARPLLHSHCPPPLALCPPRLGRPLPARRSRWSRPHR